MEQEIREVLADSARLGRSVELIRVDEDLFDAGLTSLATVNVMLGLEEKFDIEIPDDLLVRGTFQSIASLIRVISSLK